MSQCTLRVLWGPKGPPTLSTDQGPSQNSQALAPLDPSMPLPPMPAASTAQAAAPPPADAPLRWHAPQATTPAAATRGGPSWPSSPTTTSANLAAYRGRMGSMEEAASITAGESIQHHHAVACSQCSSPAAEARAVCNGAAYNGDTYPPCSQCSSPWLWVSGLYLLASAGVF